MNVRQRQTRMSDKGIELAYIFLHRMSATADLATWQILGQSDLDDHFLDVPVIRQDADEMYGNLYIRFRPIGDSRCGTSQRPLYACQVKDVHSMIICEPA